MKLRLACLLVASSLAAAGLQAADNPSYRLAAILSGTFQGSTPGNTLMVQTQPFPTDPSHPYDLFVTISGQYQEDNIRLQGVMRFDMQGPDVFVTYVPHFDLTVTAMSPEVDNFTDREAASACAVNFKPRGDGFTSETLGSSCALAIRGATSKWTLEVEPGTLRLRDAKSGETLRFKKAAS